MQKSSVESEIFPTFQHKVEWIPHFARVTEVRHIYLCRFFFETIQIPRKSLEKLLNISVEIHVKLWKKL